MTARRPTDTTVTPPSGPRPLGRLLARGVGWMLASQATIQVLAILTSVVMARFLSPRDVGLATEAIVFVTLVLGVVDFGFAAVLIQRPELSEVDRSTAFWAGLALGVALTAIGIGLSWPISWLYREPRVQPLFAVLSTTFVITAPGMVHEALLSRELKFGSLGVRTIAATAISAATMIVLAIAGFGPWAIVAQYVVIVSVSTALLWTSSPWRPRAIFSLSKLREMAGFTRDVFGARISNWATMNLDTFLVGRFRGAGPVGAYSIAFSLAITPVNRIATPLAQLLFPAFSQMRDTRQIADMWCRASVMLALVVLPAMLGIVVVGQEFVSVVFGSRWDAAAPVLQLLAGVGLLQAMTNPNNGILQSLDRTRLLFRFTVVSSVLSLCAFAAGLPWGIDGAAAGYLIANVILQPVFLYVTARTVGLSPWTWVRRLRGVGEAGLIMVACLVAARAELLWAGVGPAARLVGLIVLGAIVYGAAIAWRAPEVQPELRTLVSKLGERAPAADRPASPPAAVPAGD